MRKCKYLLLILQLFPLLLAAQEKPLPQLTIIGTVHAGNRYMNHRHIYRALKELRPDIIFIEQEQAFEKVFGLSTAAWLGLIHPSIEQLAEQKYHRNFPSTRFIPYDTVFERRGYIREHMKNEIAVYNSLEEAFHQGRMTTADSLDFGQYVLLNNYFIGHFDSSLRVLNQAHVVDSSRKLMHWEDGMLKGLVDRYIADTVLRNWYHAEKVFWHKRNRYMARVIREQLHMEPEKTYVVITGFLHKYYLEDELRQYIKR